MTALTKASRRLICLVLIGVLVSAQLAIAGHVCPVLGVSPPSGASSPAGDYALATAALASDTSSLAYADGLALAADEGQEGMAPSVPNLCLGHCQSGQQSADHTPAPAVSPALLTALSSLPAADRAPLAGFARPSLPMAGPPAGTPPHSILHCCLRD